MKKIFPLLAAVLLVLIAFAACSHEEKKPDGESDSWHPRDGPEPCARTENGEFP